MWQHEIQDWNMATCTSSTCSEANNCDGGSDGLAPFGCGHFTQQIWKTTTHMCYQVHGFYLKTHKNFRNQWKSEKSTQKVQITGSTLLHDTAHEEIQIRYTIQVSKQVTVSLQIPVLTILTVILVIPVPENKTSQILSHFIFFAWMVTSRFFR